MEAPSSKEKQLDFDLPLISTRRYETNCFDSMRVVSISQESTSRKIPFLWERAPGVPIKNGDGENELIPKPVPTPPPGRWRPSRDYNGDLDDSSDGSDDDDVISNPNNSMSTTHGSDGIGLRDFDASFIMDRFLPAANALAATSSALATPKYSKPKVSQRLQGELSMPLPMHHITSCVPRFSACTDSCEEAPSRPASNACGRMPVFPWSMKRTLCGLRSLVRSQTPRADLSLDAFVKTRRSDPGFRFDNGDGGHDDMLSIKAFKSPGWGMPFLDASRLRKQKDFLVLRGLECGSERTMKGTGGGHVVSVKRRPTGSLPQLKPPSETWLFHVLNSAKTR